MVRLVAVAQSVQHCNCVFDVGLIHVHRCEAPLERCIALNIFAKLIEGGGAHTLQLAARQRRLEHVAGIHGALRSAGAHHSVQLIDEQDDLALRFLHFVDGSFQALLKLAAEARAGNHGAEVKRHNGFIVQNFGDIVAGNLLCKSFNNSGLAHARLANQHRIIFCAPAQDLNDAQNFTVAPNHRVQLAVACHLRQVAAELLQYFIAPFGLRAGDALSAAQLLDGFHRALARDAGVSEDARHVCVALGKNCKKNMLGGNEFVFEAVGFFVGQINNALDARSDEHLSGSAAVDGSLRARAQHVIKPLLGCAVVHLHGFHQLWHGAIRLL